MRREDFELFRVFPQLGERLVRIPLGLVPTPVQRQEGLENRLSAGRLFFKRDDLSGAPYGGNKVRKLEFLLAEARSRGARTVLTFGGAGSHHALATAIYGRRLGMRAVLCLLPQPNSRAVQANLLAAAQTGAELCLRSTAAELRQCARLYNERELREGSRPLFVIPSGGSTPRGNVGYVNAAFELKAQIEQDLMPEPDFIYLAAGTCGTAAGILVGLQAAGLRSKVVLVRVASPHVAHAARVRQHARELVTFLRSVDPSFPAVSIPQSSFEIREEFFGRAYGCFTPEGQEAVGLVKELTGIPLEGTYTGKTFAALLSDAARRGLRKAVVLFWNTYNSRDLGELIGEADYLKLPAPFHPYFQKDVQELDK